MASSEYPSTVRRQRFARRKLASNLPIDCSVNGKKGISNYEIMGVLMRISNLCIVIDKVYKADNIGWVFLMYFFPLHNTLDMYQLLYNFQACYSQTWCVAKITFMIYNIIIRNDNGITEKFWNLAEFSVGYILETSRNSNMGFHAKGLDVTKTLYLHRSFPVP